MSDACPYESICFSSPTFFFVFFFAKSGIMYLLAGWEGRMGKYLARGQGVRIDFFISTSTYQICMNTNIKNRSLRGHVLTGNECYTINIVYM